MSKRAHGAARSLRLFSGTRPVEEDYDLVLRDQVVLVTGAGQGLGRAIGLAFAHVAFLESTSADWAPQVDVTPMILLLASPLSSWTTGQVVSVNGGYAMA